MTRKNATPAKRADAIRSRRSEQKPRTHFNPKQISQASQKNRVVAARPVTTRRPIPGVPTRKVVQGNRNRRYYFSLQSLGAEVRLPTLPRVRLGWRLLSGLIVVVMATAMWAMWNQPMFQVEQVKLKGGQRLTADDITTFLNVKGMPVIIANPQQMTTDLLTRFPEISKASVQVAFPALLTVSITERQPVLAWQENGSTQWVDKEGFAFPVHGDAGSLPQVNAQGDPPKPAMLAETNNTAPAGKMPISRVQFLPTNLVNAVLALKPQVPAKTPIVYDPQYGLGWDDPGGWQVFFGSDTSDMPMKLAQYRAIVAQLKAQGETPILISVEFPHAPFYRLEK